MERQPLPKNKMLQQESIRQIVGPIRWRGKTWMNGEMVLPKEKRKGTIFQSPSSHDSFFRNPAKQ